MDILRTILLIALAAMLIAAAVIDIRSRIIPNRLNAAIASLALMWWLADGLTVSQILIQIVLAAAVLTLFALAYAARMMGGGDVKLLTALALWLPAERLLLLLVCMAIGGGVLTLLMLIQHAVRSLPGRPEVPYGVAIAGAALLIVANDILTMPVAG